VKSYLTVQFQFHDIKPEFNSWFHQAASLRQLEEENHEAAARLEEVVYRGDMLLEKIQNALADIAQSQLRTRNGAPNQPPESWPTAVLDIFL